MSAIKQISLTLHGQRISGESVPIGSSVLWHIALQNPDTRLPFDITGSAVVMSVSAIGVDTIRPPVIARQANIIGSPVDGIVEVPWAPVDTVPAGVPLVPGAYLFDVWITDGAGNRLQLMGTGLITLSDASTLPATVVTPLPSQSPLAQGPPGTTGIYFLVTDYGAMGNNFVTTGGITVGTNQLTVASATGFKVGCGLYVAGAGTSNPNNRLFAKVTAINGLVLTLSINASFTVAGVAVKVDDGQAFQETLLAVEAIDGAVLKVPSGTFRIASPVNQSSFSSTLNVIIEGCGGSSKILPDRKNEDTFMLGLSTTGQRITIRDLVFIGENLGAVPNCNTLLRFSMTQDSPTTIERCSFYSILADYHLSYHSGGDVSYDSCTWQGVNTTLANGVGSMVMAFDVLHFYMVNCTQNTIGSPSASFVYVSPYPPGTGMLRSATNFVMENCFSFGCPISVKLQNAPWAFPGVKRFDHVLISDCRFQAYIDPTIYISKANHVEIARSHVGFTNNLWPALQLVDAGKVWLNRFTTDVDQPSGGPTLIDVDTLTESLTMDDCVYSKIIGTGVGVVPMFDNRGSIRAALRVLSTGEVISVAGQLAGVGALDGEVRPLTTTDGAIDAVGVILDIPAGGYSLIRVAELHGQMVVIYSDGTAIALGDFVKPSTISGGRAKKESTPNKQIIGRAYSAVAGGSEQPVNVLFFHGST